VRRRAAVGIVAAAVALGLVVPLAQLVHVGHGVRFSGPAPSATRPRPTTSPPSGLRTLPGSRVGWTRYVDPGYGINVQLPASWTFRDASAGPMGAFTLFAVGSWSFPVGEDADGCAPRPALEAVPARGVFLWWQELAIAKGVPRRPKRFQLGRPSAPECVGAPTYLIDFLQAGRPFQVQIRFGSHAPRSLRRTVLRVLDSFGAQRD
jgi:hypothetical protein